MPRCVWTNQTSDRAVPVTIDVPSATGGRASTRTVHVLPEHEPDLRAYVGRLARYGGAFFAALVGIAALLVVVPLALGGLGWSDDAIARVAGLGVAGLGGLLVALPFSTPQTVEALGVRASQRLARALGVVTVAVGVWIGLG